MAVLRESWLIQVLLPVHDNEGCAFPDRTWETIKHALAEKFGGVTAYRRAPAEGVWAPAGRQAAAEDVFIIEVMTGEMDNAWWGACQTDLQERLHQEHVVIRGIKLAEIMPAALAQPNLDIAES